MKPARSCDQITCLPSTPPTKASACCFVSGAVSSDVTSSTRCITGTGLKKCIPMTDAGRDVALADDAVARDARAHLRDPRPHEAAPDDTDFVHTHGRGSFTHSLTHSPRPSIDVRTT